MLHRTVGRRFSGPWEAEILPAPRASKIACEYTSFCKRFSGGTLTAVEASMNREEAKAVARKLRDELAADGRAREADALATLAGDTEDVYLRLRKRFYTPSEVAERVGVSRQTVIKWIERGELEAELTPGGHHRIPASVFQSGRRSERADIKLVPARK
jgi:excisionase family DNA binding protein